jgi:outer membrane protein TolC
MNRALASLAVLVALVPSAARAEEAPPPYVPPDFLAGTPPLPPGRDAAAALRLDLAEALRLAIANNLDVALERDALRIARLGIDVAGGGFEPALTAGYGHDSFDSPPETAQEGMPGEIVTSIDDSWRVGIQQRLPTGTQLQVDWGNGRSKSTGGTAVAPLNFRSTLTVGITQPLLRGFSLDLDIPRIAVLRARIASERERAQLVVAMTAVVERAEAAYWSVLQALYRYDLARRTYDAATAQLQLTRRQIEAGTLPRSDVIGAEATLAQRELELVQADEAIEQATDQLRAVLNLPREDWARPILPTDVPRFTAAGVTAESALAVALEHRPELAQLQLDLQASLLALRQADNDRLPQIDLGLSGTLVGQDASYAGALDQLGGADAKGWSVLVNLTWTPLGRASRAGAKIARAQHHQQQLRRDQVLQGVWVEVREAVRNQEGAERQLRAAARFRELAAQSLEVEQRKFLNGTSQNLFVAQRQDALASAQLAELDALLGHNRAAATLSRATGRLLADRQIEIAVGK